MNAHPVTQSRADGPTFDDTEVPRYYARKTQDILHKYGPGPRVHFHVGLFDPSVKLNTTVSQRVLKNRIVSSQEAILDHAARTWAVGQSFPAHLLDVGCGLGGGSLYWAQEHGANVTGLTVANDHIPVIRELARQAGVSGRVAPRVGDIHDLTHERRYDAAYAIESSGYMDRKRLFQVVARALRPGGGSAFRSTSSAVRNGRTGSTTTTRRGSAPSPSTSTPLRPPASSWNRTRTSRTESASSGSSPWPGTRLN